jgi:hypothetical protein
MITAQFFLVGSGIIRDEAAVRAMSRSGNRREILKKVRAYVVVQEVIGGDGIEGVCTEYPIPLTLDPTPTRRDPGDAGQRK